MVLAHPTKEKLLDDGRTREFGIEEDAVQEVFQTDSSGFKKCRAKLI
jgi:hypothetical protein